MFRAAFPISPLQTPYEGPSQTARRRRTADVVSSPRWPSTHFIGREVESGELESALHDREGRWYAPARSRCTYRFSDGATAVPRAALDLLCSLKGIAKRTGNPREEPALHGRTRVPKTAQGNLWNEIEFVTRSRSLYVRFAFAKSSPRVRQEFAKRALQKRVALFMRNT